MNVTTPRPAPTGALPDPREGETLVDFPAGIPGFEMCRRFMLVTSADLSPLGCLRALEPPEASFLVIDPKLVSIGYDQTLREFERARIRAEDGDPLLWLAIVTVTADGAAANLRAPVVINARRMIGCQFIRDDSTYPVSFAIGLD